MNRILLALVVLFLAFESSATHVVGGSLTYEHLGGSSYNVKLKLYRDCTPGTFDFPTSVDVEVRYGNGATAGLAFTTFTMPRLGRIVLEPPLDSCAVDPGICVEEAVFSAIISLPPSATGYHLYWGLCCRNGSVQNIFDPLNVTEMFHTYIPNNALLLTNSSPSWTNFPPVFVCQGQDVDFDHSATDADGDSLVYSLYTPYQDNAPTYNANPFPDNIQFTPVPWEAGFSANNPLNVSGTTLVINPTTGLLTGIPEDIGQFIVGIKCEEYRDGVKIGVIVRDFQFNVVNCPPLKEAGIGPIIDCDGIDVQMVNSSSAGAEDFYWDFGDGSPGVFQTAPIHTFPGVGDYLITLIAQYNTVCADTATYLFKVGEITGTIDFIDSICVNGTVNFSESSTVTGNMIIDSWQWNFGDGSPNSTVPNPSHVYNVSGDLTVNLVVGTDAGCYDTIAEPLYVQGLPNADVGPDTTACFNNPNINLNGIISNAQGGVWVGNGGIFTPSSSDLNANYSPSVNEINNGFTYLILSTTGNGFCPSNQDSLRIDFIDGPIIDVGPDLEVCSDTASVPLSATFDFAGGVEWYTNAGTGSFTNPLTANTFYIPSAGDIANDSVVIYAQTIINGNCFGQFDSLTIYFFEPPTISLVYPDTICANNPLYLNSNATTGSGIWSTNGDGNFIQDTSVVTAYIHGTGDLANGSVEIYYQTINNGGCQIQRDTINVAIIPSPEINFSFTTECFGTPTIFSSDVTSTEPIASYSWILNGSEFSDIANPSYVIPVLDTNEITLIVTSQNGCSDTVALPVSTYYLPEVSFLVPAPCLNGGAQFLDQSSVIGANITDWNWTFGDDGSSSEQDPNYQYADAGVYLVELTVTSDQGCSNSASNSVEIFPGPNANFENDPSFANVFQNISFTDLSTSQFPLINWTWDYSDGNISNDQNSIHNYDEGGNYVVYLIVEDENGCTDTAQNIVHIYLPPLVPSGFSPNGDLSNDFLYVYGGPFDFLEFRVYNNWGEVIFESNDITIGWDGKYQGVDQPIGVYVWTVKAYTSDGAIHEISGDSSLIR